MNRDLTPSQRSNVNLVYRTKEEGEEPMSKKKHTTEEIVTKNKIVPVPGRDA